MEEKEEKIVFSQAAFDAGACASFVKDSGRVAVDVRASFSIAPETVKKRLATHSFIEFAEVSAGACLVQNGSDQPPCVFLLTNAVLSNAVLREIGRRISHELGHAVFLFANAKAKMKPVTEISDERFEAFAATMIALARHLFQEEKA